MKAFSLAGKRILVTGANTGIGQGIAVSIARAGGTIVGVGRSPMDDTEKLVREEGGLFEAQRCDLADTGAARQMLDQVMDAGPLDGLVNNAGIIRRADAIDFSEQDWDDVMDVNLKTLFFLAQAYARTLVAENRTGKVVNVASMLSFQGGIRVASYTTSKSGLAGLTRLLANEWAAKNINVNAIAPGYVVSNNTAALRGDEDRSAAILARIPAGRWGSPEDIGGAAVYLASDAARYVHGAVLAVDGGWLAR